MKRNFSRSVIGPPFLVVLPLSSLRPYDTHHEISFHLIVVVVYRYGISLLLYSVLKKLCRFIHFSLSYGVFTSTIADVSIIFEGCFKLCCIHNLVKNVIEKN